jgi:hypothetical protein
VHEDVEGALDGDAALGDVVILDGLDAALEKANHAIVESDDQLYSIHACDRLLLIAHAFLPGMWAARNRSRPRSLCFIIPADFR